MKCIECGHELKDGAIFCIRCGAMQVSMDGKPIERGADWPTVEAQSGASGFKSSTDGALHSAQSKNPKGFKPAPKHNGGRIAAIIIVIVVLVAIIAFALTQCMGPAASGDGSSATTTTTSSSASDSTTSSTATSSASASTSSASASASASSASASASAGSTTSTQSASAAAEEPQQQAPAPEPEPEPAPTYQNDYYVLPDSSSYYYSWDELNSMSTYDLYIARNEIYARHGRMFNRSDLQDYFNSQAWYVPLYTPSEFDGMSGMLSDVEVSNAYLMRDVEAAKGSPYL